MTLTRLEISDFRNLKKIKLNSLSEGFNLIYGNNGSGKTSLLESIYYLSTGRSFRNTLTTRVINKEAEKFSLFAELKNELQIISLGLEKQDLETTKLRLAGQDIYSISEFANLLPIQLINSNSYHLLEAPIFRRKYLDWGCFYWNNQFFPAWKQFSRALKQRNAALRDQVSFQELTAWTAQLIESSVILDQIRQDYLSHLFPIFQDTLQSLINIPYLQIEYYRGWNSQQSYQAILEASLTKDRQSGHTQFGPHRADLKVNIAAIPAKDILSRGQQKLFVCAMIVAQGALLLKALNKKPIYLVDDLPAELDLNSRTQLLSLLSNQDAQVFVTAIEREIIEGILQDHQIKMFHVEHGQINEVAEEVTAT